MPADKTSVRIWIKPESVATVQGLGFRVQKDEQVTSADKWYITSSEHPFDPTAKIRNVPDFAISEVTVRSEAECQLEPGMYQLVPVATMRVAELNVCTNVQQGMYRTERMLPSKTHRHIELRADTLVQALQLWTAAWGGKITPDLSIPAEAMDAFGKEASYTV